MGIAGDVSAAKPASPKLKGSEGPKNAGSKKPSQGPASPSRASKKFVKFLYELEEQVLLFCSAVSAGKQVQKLPYLGS